MDIQWISNGRTHAYMSNRHPHFTWHPMDPPYVEFILIGPLRRASDCTRLGSICPLRQLCPFINIYKICQTSFGYLVHCIVHNKISPMVTLKSHILILCPLDPTDMGGAFSLFDHISRDFHRTSNGHNGQTDHFLIHVYIIK